MGIISQVKDGEYMITTFDGGHVVKEIDQTGKVSPVTPKKILTRYEFWSLFTFQEMVAITTAAKTDVAIEVFMESMRVAEEINLDYPETIQGLTYLVSVELITQQKMDDILAGV